MKINILFLLIGLLLSPCVLSQKVARPGGGGEKEIGRTNIENEINIFIKALNQRLNFCEPKAKKLKNFEEMYEFLFQKHFHKMLSGKEKLQPKLEVKCFNDHSKDNLSCLLTNQVQSKLKKLTENPQLPTYLKSELNLRDEDIEYRILFLKLLNTHEDE